MKQVKIDSTDFNRDWTEYDGSNDRECAMAALLDNKEYIVGDLDQIYVEVKNRYGTIQKFKARVTFELEAV